MRCLTPELLHEWWHRGVCRKLFNLRRGFNLKRDAGRDLWQVLSNCENLGQDSQASGEALPPRLLLPHARVLRYFWAKHFNTFSPFNSLPKQNNVFPLNYFKQKDSFFIKQLLLYNGSSVLIIFIFSPKDLFYITKQICQLFRKFSSFLLQMIEGELIYVKGKVGIIKTSV